MNCSCICYCLNCSQLLVALASVVLLNISMSIGQKLGTYFIANIGEACSCHSRKCSYLQTPSSFTLPPVKYDAGAGYLTLSRDPYERGMWCTITIIAPSSMTVAARLRKYRYSYPTKLSSNRSFTTSQSSDELSTDILKTASAFSDPLASRVPFGSCNDSAVQFYDGGSVFDSSKRLAEMCNSAPRTLNKISDIRSTSNELTLNFYQRTNGPETVTFSITFTYVANRTEGCLSTEFSCKSRHDCISSKLVCDSLENCPDGSDEAMDHQRCSDWTQPSHLYKTGSTPTDSRFPVSTSAKVLLGCGSAVFFGVFLFTIAVKVKRGDNLEYRGRASRWDRCELNEQRQLSRERRLSRLTVSLNGVHSYNCDNNVEAIDDNTYIVLDSEDADGIRRGRGDNLSSSSAHGAAVLETGPLASRSSAAAGLHSETSAPPPDYSLLFPDSASRVHAQRNSLPSYSELDEYCNINR